MSSKIFDLAIVGGGINGCGIANDAAGRGLNVFLCEQNDLASGTSSASSKLIHGGLRYLEHYEFRLVREALKEREVLLRKAPHLVKPLKFTMPHRPHLRPAWMIRIGLFLYDHLCRENRLPRTRTTSLIDNSPFKNGITKGFQYYDCWVDDARLVITNAKQARQLGADIRVQTQCTRLEHLTDSKLWKLTLKNTISGDKTTILSRHVVNAAGPWLNLFQTHAIEQIKPTKRIRLIKGSHIVVPKVSQSDEAFILQNEDKRVVFVLPYQNKFSIIGTTDKEYNGDPAKVEIDDQEIDYLLAVYNSHFKQPLSREDIVNTYSGIRPLCDDESADPSAITRDYTIDTQAIGENALVSIYGGKITTYRKLAEAVMAKLSNFIPNLAPPWTAHSPLPGAGNLDDSYSDILDLLAKQLPWLSHATLERYARSYGLDCLEFLDGKSKQEDLGHCFGSDLYQCEVDYLLHEEWSNKADDILWRRSKLGLELSAAETQALQSYITSEQEPVVEHTPLAS